MGFESFNIDDSPPQEKESGFKFTPDINLVEDMGDHWEYKGKEFKKPHGDIDENDPNFEMNQMNEKRVRKFETEIWADKFGFDGVGIVMENEDIAIARRSVEREESEEAYHLEAGVRLSTGEVLADWKSTKDGESYGYDVGTKKFNWENNG